MNSILYISACLRICFKMLILRYDEILVADFVYPCYFQWQSPLIPTTTTKITLSIWSPLHCHQPICQFKVIFQFTAHISTFHILFACSTHTHTHLFDSILNVKSYPWQLCCYCRIQYCGSKSKVTSLSTYRTRNICVF